MLAIGHDPQLPDEFGVPPGLPATWPVSWEDAAEAVSGDLCQAGCDAALEQVMARVHQLVRAGAWVGLAQHTLGNRSLVTRRVYPNCVVARGLADSRSRAGASVLRHREPRGNRRFRAKAVTVRVGYAHYSRPNGQLSGGRLSHRLS